MSLHVVIPDITREHWNVNIRKLLHIVRWITRRTLLVAWPTAEVA